MKELSSLDGGSAKKSSGKTTGKPSSKQPVKPALKPRGKRDLRPLIAFALTLVLYLAAMVLCNKYPLGQYSFLQSDLKSQYAPFLALLKNKLADLNSVPGEHVGSYLTYSFQLGLGKNFMSTFGYYLASPFNLIYLFVDEAQIDAAVITIVILKLSLAASFMSLFLGKRIEDKKSYWPVLLGIAYAFSLYSQAYIFHIMWLDGYMLLPLILFFTEKFISEQKYLGLIVTLLMLFATNYYIAYMAGIACFLYLCIRMFVLKIDIKKAAGICVRYVLTAGFTALITAVLLVPVGLDTIGNADRTILTRGDSAITYSPLTLIHMFLLGEPGDFRDIMISNYPFLFICLPVTILMLIYFISPVFKGRERKVHAFSMLGVLLSTAVYVIDKAWQVFDDPNWFWHRQVFVFLPLFLMISLRVLLKIKEVARKDIVRVMLIMFALIVIDCSFGALKGQSKAVVYNFVLTLVYCGFLSCYSIGKWPEQLHDMPKMISPLMSFIVVFELVFAGPMLSSGIETMTLFGGPAEEYSDSIRAESQFGDYAKARNASTGTFRAETDSVPEYTLKYYIDEGQAFYGDYHGLSFFNSNSNKPMQRFVKQLGMQTNYNYFATGHSYTAPSTDCFFSIASVSAKRDIDIYRLEGSDSYGAGLKFYANDDVLPLGFAADKGAMDFDFYRLEKDTSEKNYYALQNDWYRSMFPEAFTEDFFCEIDESVTGAPEIKNGVSFKSGDYLTNEDYIRKNDPEYRSRAVTEDPFGLEKNVYYELKDEQTVLYKSNEKIPIVIEYNFKAPTTDEIYCSLVTGRIVDGADVFVNGIKISSFNSDAYYSQIFRIGSFEEGEDVKVTFLASDKSFTYLNIRFASFDTAKFSEQLAEVNTSKVSMAEAYDGYVKFNVNGLEENETVITTIPVEEGWQLYIDGSPCDYKVYQNAFISFDAGSGSHTAELVFTAPGLKGGAAVSCAGIVLLAAFVFVDKKRTKMKEKQ